MKSINPWTLLRGDKKRRIKGLRMIESTDASEQTASSGMELGIAYLWLREYDLASKHFCKLIDNVSLNGDAFYGMAGVAKWCLGQSDLAVAEWRKGLRARYARASGLGVRMPLLLFFASVTQPNLVDLSYVKDLLHRTSADPRIKNWPGPIAQFILDQISQAELVNCIETPDEQDSKDRYWLAAFYKSLKAAEKNSSFNLKKPISELGDANQPEWRDNNVLLSRIWNEEFFLARQLGETLNATRR